MANIRYIKILIDGGTEDGYNGILTIAELQAFKSGDSTNYALNKVATASSSYNSGTCYPSKAVDGILSGPYNSFATQSGSGHLNLDGSQWFLLDLGSIMPIASLSLYTIRESGYGAITDYRVQISDDGISFKTVKTFSNMPPNQRVDIIDLPASNKLLFLSNDNKLWTYTTLWEVIGNGPPTDSLFNSFGITDISASALKELSVLAGSSKIDVLAYAPIDSSNPTSSSTIPNNFKPMIVACPKPQFVYATGDIDLSGSQNIDWIHINNGISNSVTGNSKLKYIFSVDKGVTWKTYKAGAFIDILNTANVADGSVVGGRFIPSTDAITRLLADGLDKANFDSAPWNETTIALGNELIRFAAIFDLDKTTDNCYNDNLTYQYDGNSVWKQAINGVDYEARFTSPRKLEIKFLTGGYKAKVNY